MLNRVNGNVLKCIQFIKENIHFFQDLLAGSDTVKELINGEVSPLCAAMQCAFTVDPNDPMWTSMASFRNAIFGNEDFGMVGLVDNNVAYLVHYLQANPQMIKALLQNRHDPLIEKWHQKYNAKYSQTRYAKEAARHARNTELARDTFMEKPVLSTSTATSISISPGSSSESTEKQKQVSKVEPNVETINEDYSNLVTYGLFAAGVFAVAAGVVQGLSWLAKKR